MVFYFSFIVKIIKTSLFRIIRQAFHFMSCIIRLKIRSLNVKTRLKHNYPTSYPLNKYIS